MIGLGIIGSRVAENLRRAKFQTYVWNRTPKPVPNFLPSPGAVADTCEILQIFVADPAALTSVLEMLKPKLKPHHLVLNHATVSPEATAAAADLVSSTGATFLDAPFTGSKDAAANAQIVYFIGGETAALERARPVLEASGRKVIHIGKTGDATLIKIAMNLMIAMQTQAMVEALALTTANGLDPGRFAEVLSENAARSGVSEMKLPKILVGDYDPHFSIKHMLKDVQFGMKIAEDCGLVLPSTQVAGGALLQAMTEGHGELDFSAIANNFPFLIATEPEIPTPEELAEEGEPELETQTDNALDFAAKAGIESEDTTEESSAEELNVGPPAGALIASMSRTGPDTEPAATPSENDSTTPSILPVLDQPHLPEPPANILKRPLTGENGSDDEIAQEEEPAPAESSLGSPMRVSDLADNEEKLVITPPKPTITKKVSIWGRPGLFRPRNED